MSSLNHLPFLQTVLLYRTVKKIIPTSEFYKHAIQNSSVVLELRRVAHQD